MLRPSPSVFVPFCLPLATRRIRLPPDTAITGSVTTDVAGNELFESADWTFTTEGEP